MTKKNIIFSAILITILLSLIFLLLGKNIEKLLAIAVLVIFMLFALLDPPPKHKNFGYKDVKKATNLSSGISVDTETDMKIDEYSKKMRRKNKNE